MKICPCLGLLSMLSVLYAESGAAPAGQPWTPESPYVDGEVRSLSLRADGSFRILVLADTQLGFLPWRDTQTLRLVDTLVSRTRPDLILALGDNSEFLFSPLAARRLASRLGRLGLPWGLVLGNHDTEGFRDREWFGRLYAAAEGSLFSRGPESIHGVGNWPLVIRDAEGRAVFSLVMLDSNSYRRYPGSTVKGVTYDWIYPDQIAWYEWFVRGVSTARFGAFDPGAGKVVPSLLFFHIPLPQFTEAIEALKAGRLGPDPELGEVRGVAKEAPCVPLADTGLFETVKRLGSTREIIVGHDHVNNSSIPWEGIRLTYATKSGLTSYYDDNLLGGTLVTIAPRDGGFTSSSEAILIPRR